MKRSLLMLCVMLVVVALAAGNAAYANTVYAVDLPGIGSQIPILSYSFGAGNTLSFTKDIDGFSPLLSNSVVLGTAFSTGSLDTYDTLVSTTIPTASFAMTNIILTSLQYSGNTDRTFETVTLQYETGTLVSTAVPEPSSLMLLGSGFIGLLGLKSRKKIHP